MFSNVYAEELKGDITSDEAQELMGVARPGIIYPSPIDASHKPIDTTGIEWNYLVIEQKDVERILGKNYKLRLKNDKRLLEPKLIGFDKGYGFGYDGQLCLFSTFLYNLSKLEANKTNE